MTCLALAVLALAELALLHERPFRRHGERLEE
jgi:hypothetical protein